MLTYLKSLLLGQPYYDINITCEAYGDVNGLVLPMQCYTIKDHELKIIYSRNVSPKEEYMIQWFKFIGYVDIYNYHVSDSIFIRKFCLDYENSKESWMHVKAAKSISFTLSLKLTEL